MGIVNTTPDSFSDGGRYHARDDAAAHIDRLIDQGADIIDVGGESTRPGAAPVPLDEELERTAAPIAHASATGKVASIDTRSAAVMEAALKHDGTTVINDVSALRHDAGSLELAIRYQAPVILMHMKGEPATMNQAPHYDDMIAEIVDWLGERAETCIRAGLDRGCIALDPGLGFAKKHKHNLALLHHLEQLVDLGFPVCMGASRKLAKWAADDSVRLAVSTTAAVIAAQKGVAILRVHDVVETRAALRVAGFDMP